MKSFLFHLVVKTNCILSFTNNNTVWSPTPYKANKEKVK